MGIFGDIADAVSDAVDTAEDVAKDVVDTVTDAAEDAADAAADVAQTIVDSSVRRSSGSMEYPRRTAHDFKPLPRARTSILPPDPGHSRSTVARSQRSALWIA